MDVRLTATDDMVRQFEELLVNRRAYTVQSIKPNPESGRHYYYRPTVKGTRETLELTDKTIRRHLEGDITIALYAINPETQRSKWLAIDADYRHALEDLLKLQCELRHDGIQAALEKSKRGAHLWVFFSTPVLAREARLYVLNLADRLTLPVKGAGWPEGIEVFPRQDRLVEGEFGNAIRAPLGVHRGAGKRYWFYGADYSLEAQFRYLAGLDRVSEAALEAITSGMRIPEQYLGAPRKAEARVPPFSFRGEFRILDYVAVRRKSGRNYWARCPSCSESGHDTGGDNLAISIEEPQKYKCWAGCTKEMIRAALGRPIPLRRFA
jgi:hypothetical protein